MDHDSRRKGKEPESSTTTQQASDDDLTPPASPPHASPTLPQPPSSSNEPSSSADQLGQEAQRRNLSTTDDVPASQDTPPASPRINLSSIPRALDRPLFNPPSGSGSQPPPQPSQLATSTVTGSSSASGSSCDQKVAASLRLLKPTDRADFRRLSEGKKVRRKKRKRDSGSEAGRTRVKRTLPRPSPLGPGLSPYQKVQKCLAELKDFIKNLANPDTSEEPPQPQPQRLPDPSQARPTLPSSSAGPTASATTDQIHTASMTSSSRAEVGLAPRLPQPLLDPATARPTSGGKGPIAPQLPQPLFDPPTARPTSGGKGPIAPPLPQPLFDPPTARPTSGGKGPIASWPATARPTSGGKGPIAQPTTEEDEEDYGWTVEEVIDLMEDFLKRVPSTIGAQEMENGLLEIQTRLGIDPRPTWYSLMSNKSYEELWEDLIDYFNCDALDKANLVENVIEKDPSASGAGPSSAPTS